ncbi:putative lipoprotein [Minicystis rosea]|nr:putative lipoprotein [Minicystis rosea]
MRAVSDDDRKNKAREQDEEAEETSSSDAADETTAEASAEQEESHEGDDDGAAHRVADALGVSDGEEAAADKAEGEPAEGEGEEAAPVQNRAARRAEAAQRRKKRKSATAAPAEGEEADDLPKDKNARAKELLKRRREQAAGGSEARPVQLLPSEMVDDALARSASAVGKWLRANFGVLQYFILAAIVGGGGYALYTSQVDKKSGGASDALLAGVRADHGRVMAEDKRGEEEKEVDPTRVFKTAEERSENALASYRKVVADHPGTGAAILARLGEAGTLLDKHEWDKAMEAYSAVSSSTLASADTDVKARALEGLGFAKEGKGDKDGAMAAFKELQGIVGNKELGQYHEARLLLGKGEKDKAKDLFKQIHDALEKPTEVRTTGFLKAAVDDNLRRLDPSLVPAKPVIGGGAKGAAMSQEEIEKALKRLRENMEKQQKEKH